jgi:hypothetical protein
MKNPEVILRIAELRKPVIDKTLRTLDTILADIETLRKSGMLDDKKLALDCLKHEAKLKGFEVAKTDVTSNGKGLSPTIVINTQLTKQGE